MSYHLIMIITGTAAVPHCRQRGGEYLGMPELYKEEIVIHPERTRPMLPLPFPSLLEMIWRHLPIDTRPTNSHNRLLVGY